MKQTLMIFTLGIALHAGPVFDQTQIGTGGGTYTYGWSDNSPEWNFSIDGYSCDKVGGWGCYGSSVEILLQPLAGVQEGDIDIAGVVTQFDTFGTVTNLSCTWIAPGFPSICQETFSFSPVAESPGFIFPVSGSGGGAGGGSAIAAVPEPSGWLLVLSGAILVALKRKVRQ